MARGLMRRALQQERHGWMLLGWRDFDDAFMRRFIVEEQQG